jgi:hypothetical protein
MCAPPSDTCSDCATHLHHEDDITPTTLTVEGIVEAECTEAEEVVTTSLCVGGYEYAPEEVEVCDNGAAYAVKLFVRGSPCGGGAPSTLECECDCCKNNYFYVLQADVWLYTVGTGWSRVSTTFLFTNTTGFVGDYTCQRPDDYVGDPTGSIDIICCKNDFYRCESSIMDNPCTCAPGAIVPGLEPLSSINWNDNNCCYLTSIRLVKDYSKVETIVECTETPGWVRVTCPALPGVTPGDPPAECLEVVLAVEVAISCGYKPNPGQPTGLAWTQVSITCPQANSGGFHGGGIGWRDRYVAASGVTTLAATLYIDFSNGDTDGPGPITDDAGYVYIGTVKSNVWSSRARLTIPRSMWASRYVGKLCDININMLNDTWTVVS